jgi:DNA-binding winged helix-turn-helix (wHTH) protein/WD40 repeat protein
MVQFGPFEFDPVTNELRKHGIRLKLLGQPAQLLSALLETPGEVVSRGDLQKRLWPADTFVDFENGLNSAAKRLRGALNDSADHPVYIETLARTGYRFIAPVSYYEPDVEAAPAGLTPERPRNYLWPALAAVLACAAGWLALRTPELPAFRQITFRKGPVFSARFAPDGQSVVMSAQFDQQPRQIYVNNGVSPEARSLGLAGVSIFSVSRQGQLALYEYGGTMPTSGGRISKVPINGGTPVAVDDNIMAADWHPDGQQLALVRVANGQSTLEFPAGNVLFRTAGWISGVRFNAAGKKIAFVDHPVRHDDAGWIKTVTIDGAIETLGDKWLAVHGVAWHPNGEVWFAATRDGSPRSLWAAPARVVGRFPGAITLRDISSAGAVLLSRDQRRLETYANGRDVTWFDWTRAVDITNDGSLLFDESGEAAGTRSVTFVRGAGAIEAARLADGWLAQGFSPDRVHALTLSFDNRRRLRLYTLSGGRPVDLKETGLEYQWARFFPDGRSLLALASERSSGLRLFRVWLNSEGATPLSEPGMVRYSAISADSKRVAYLSAAGKLMEIVPGGDARELYSAEPLAPVQWSRDGKRLYVQHVRSASLPARISKFDPGTGRLEAWKEVAPSDPAGVDLITRVLISEDENQLVFSARRVQSELFTASGLR